MEYLAVLDLGSNSFHMLVAQMDEQQHIQIIDKLKETSRLAAGLDEHKMITEECKIRTLQYFAQYAQRLKNFQKSYVRVVATDTFRRAKNGLDFLKECEQTLGFPIEIISGMEEARLIYQGVSHDFPSNNQRLVIDIGGGSTELIIGKQNIPIELASTKMGCVSWTMNYFSPPFTKNQFENALVAAEQTLMPQIRKYKHLGWQEAFGTSGTIKAISDICREMHQNDGTIRLEDLKLIQKVMLEVQYPELLPWTCLSETRKEVLIGGVSILKALMKSLKIQKMEALPVALREGVLVEMVGRIFGEDIREKSIISFQNRFVVDAKQIQRILETIEHLYQSCHKEWRLTDEDLQMLRWAVQLHEIGLTVAFSGYHRHSAYMVVNADLAGFSKNQQAELALYIYGHRGKVKLDAWQDILPRISTHHKRMIALLRIATRIHRGRNPKEHLLLHLEIDENRMHLHTPADFFKKRQLTKADLELEILQLQELDLIFRFD